MQHAMRHDVMSPQNGHILCARSSRTCGRSTASSLLNESVRRASRRLSRLRNGYEPGSIDPPLPFSLDWRATGLRERLENRFAAAICGRLTMTGLRKLFCARLLTCRATKSALDNDKMKLSNSDQLLLMA
jgi:hypothetical protein